MKQIIKTDKAPNPVGPYNQGIVAGNTLYTSGQIPIDPTTGKLVEGDISLQAKQVMENLKAILKEAGMDFENVVKTTIFIANLDNFAMVNKVYGEYFDSMAPARETAQAVRLPMGAELEISLIAVK